MAAARSVAQAAAVGQTGLKERLKEDAQYRGLGAFLMSGSPLVAELMAHAGYDFLVVDMEHSPVDVHGALPMLQAVAAAGRPALVRVALNRPELIKKALDLGPAGLIVPLVDSAEEARAVAAACRYPTRGLRGVAYPLVRASAWGLDANYVRRCEKQCLVLCQVETPAAVNAVEDILQVDGVDGIFVGPLDLSASLGHLGDTRHADVLSALARIEAAAAKHPSKVLAGFAGGRRAHAMFAAGYRLVATSADVALLRDAARVDIAAAAAPAPAAAAAARPGEVVVVPGAEEGAEAESAGNGGSPSPAAKKRPRNS